MRFALRNKSKLIKAFGEDYYKLLISSLTAFAHMPANAVQLLKDLGLAVFVACVGLSAGPEAVSLIREHGAVLPLIGLLVSLGPACLSLWVGHKLLKIEGPLLVGPSLWMGNGILQRWMDRRYLQRECLSLVLM